MEKHKKTVKIVAVSDTHDKHKNIDLTTLPPADIFVHAGDFTKMSRPKEFNKFRQFIQSLPYKHKIVVPGNHDFGLETTQERYQLLSKKFGLREKELVNPEEELKKLKEVCTVLIHEEVQIEGVKFFGSPYVSSDIMMGFTYPPPDGEQVWANLPKNIDVLITHGPPFGIHDLSEYNNSHSGCKFLLNAVQILKPKLHIFGHIHESAGQTQIGPTRFYNVSYCDRHYNASNKPILIELQVEGE